MLSAEMMFVQKQKAGLGQALPEFQDTPMSCAINSYYFTIDKDNQYPLANLGHIVCEIALTIFYAVNASIPFATCYAAGQTPSVVFLQPSHI